jgi:hypothetical protein
MPTYKVLRTIEHNCVIYLPAEAVAALGAAVAEKLPSGGTGGFAPINTSGVIELTEVQAAALDPVIHGQIPVFEGKPDSVEAEKAREATQLKAEAEARAKEKTEKRK